jgi:hypothetical protein
MELNQDITLFNENRANNLNLFGKSQKNLQLLTPGPLSKTAAWNKTLSAMASSIDTFPPPPDSPKIRARLGSPPKRSIVSENGDAPLFEYYEQGSIPGFHLSYRIVREDAGGTQRF